MILSKSLIITIILSDYIYYIALIIASYLRYKTPSFDDNFFIRKEMKYTLLSSLFAIFLNIPHMIICLSIINNDNIELNYAIYFEIYHIVAAFTLFIYSTASFSVIMITTLYTIKKKRKWILLLSTDIQDTINELNKPSARLSLRFSDGDPLENVVRGSEIILSTFNLTQIDDEQTMCDIHRHQKDTKNMELDEILKEEEGFNGFMFHLSTEFSIEIMISLIEFYQFKQYIDDNEIYTNHNEYTLLEDVLRMKNNQYIPKSHIIQTNNFKNSAFCNKYKDIFDEWMIIAHQRLDCDDIDDVDESITLRPKKPPAFQTQPSNSASKSKEFGEMTMKKFKFLFEIMIIGFELHCKYIDIGSLAEINISFVLRNRLIGFFGENEDVERFIKGIMDDDLIRNNIHIMEIYAIFYHIFDEATEEMTKLINYSYTRFQQSVLYQKLRINYAINVDVS